ncbi:NADPH-dependent 7-cyano-7-deazaguanine reductase QueF [Zhongshania sp. BJYM1]|jgi:7-cyano-7-deazaguanine reductase|uniref:NADPH-dependent 7-cyano-7-deazaguanine reductase QueF n=1 Tax=Zhongshania aquatica TaxID=2965069 RepID=UPI0022B5D894|nr:NADPH-dependent 7-cyano-7-deazaguanine reductase QueF [Marortus sp. BJYM1]
MSDKKHHGPLGEKVDYPQEYDPSCLHPISRDAGRETLGLGGASSLPFSGVDIWNAYEVSWLTESGMPKVACAEFRFPADSPNIVESKSFKLYLNSFNQSRIKDVDALKRLLLADLSRATGADVEVEVYTPNVWAEVSRISLPVGECLDELDISPSSFLPAPELLQAVSGEVVSEKLYSNLLRSRCPVTSQPDWATVEIHYRGPKINRSQLLAYIVSFREHDEFHEHCVERIFSDLISRLQPESLTVYARYTRRGGLDINPWRSTDSSVVALNARGARQ